MIVELFTALLAAPPASALWGGLGVTAVLIANKLFPSLQESKDSKREDFTAITGSLFKEIELLKGEIERYKKDSENCEKQYTELNERFVDFKRTYNELELRYNIQIRINKKLADEITHLEGEIKTLQEKDNLIIIDEDKESTNNTNPGTSK